VVGVQFGVFALKDQLKVDFFKRYSVADPIKLFFFFSDFCCLV